MKECKWAYSQKILSPSKVSELNELKSFSPERSIYAESEFVDGSNSRTWEQRAYRSRQIRTARQKKFEAEIKREESNRSKRITHEVKNSQIPNGNIMFCDSIFESRGKEFTPLAYNNGKRGKDRFNFDSVVIQKIGKKV
jgi:hypothetical protein